MSPAVIRGFGRPGFARSCRGPGAWCAGERAVVAEILPSTAAGDRRNEPSQAVFQQEWRIYRTLVDENYLFHREAYACLHRILVEGVRRPFRFLDVACGDATASVEALTGTAITQYHGIDLSAAALELARSALAVLDCPVTLEHADYVEALRDWREPPDVVWIGLSLHHLRTVEKLAVLRAIRTILAKDGHLFIYEATCTPPITPRQPRAGCRWHKKPGSPRRGKPSWPHQTSSGCTGCPPATRPDNSPGGIPNAGELSGRVA